MEGVVLTVELEDGASDYRDTGSEFEHSDGDIVNEGRDSVIKL